MLEAAAMRTVLLLGTLASAAFASQSLAQQSTFASGGKLSFAAPGASAWEKTKGGRLRLVTQPAGPDGTARAALEIELEPGFKTYWWNPGADGIPPQVSFFGSRNVKDTQLALPPPHVFREKSVSVGYKGAVRFPIRVTPEDAGQPYRLTATGVVGFCAEICVPVPFRLSATSPKDAAAGEAVTAQRMLTPSEGLKIDAARFEASTGKLEVQVTVPDTDVHLELLVANPDGKELPPAAQSVHQKGDRAIFSFDLTDEQFPAAGEHLTFTLVVARFGQDGRIGVEQTLAVARVE